MSSPPAINATVKITVKDINGNSVAKQFNNVTDLQFNFFKGTVKIYDLTGEFIFTLVTITTLTYTVLGSVTTVVMS